MNPRDRVRLPAKGGREYAGRLGKPMSACATQALAQSNPYLSAILIKKTLDNSVFFRIRGNSVTKKGDDYLLKKQFVRAPLEIFRLL